MLSKYKSVFRSVFSKPRSTPARVGIMTCVWNEVACAAFAVGAFIDHVDLYVFIDTGSTDGTEALIRQLYPKAIEEDRLIVEQLGRLPDYDLSIARNRALEIFRHHQIDYCLKIDADDIFYDEGAAELVSNVRNLPECITHFRCRTRELYQWEISTTEAWLEAIKHQRDIFWEMPFVPAIDRGFAVNGAIAKGKWFDEAEEKLPENLYYNRPAIRKETRLILGVHYGWARPVEKKKEKISVWHGTPDKDPRVDTLHLGRDWRRPKRKFRDHPEVFQRLIDSVITFVKTGS